jgi:hypothetical protein
VTKIMVLDHMTGFIGTLVTVSLNCSNTVLSLIYTIYSSPWHTHTRILSFH